MDTCSRADAVTFKNIVNNGQMILSVKLANQPLSGMTIFDEAAQLI